jgi:hypothetical protein
MTMPCETGVEDDEGRWWCSTDKLVVVVGRCIRKREAGGQLGLKTMKTSVAAHFRVHHVKLGRRVMRGGGGVVQISWWWWWGIAFANARQEGD